MHPRETTDEAVCRIINEQGWEEAILRVLAFQWMKNAGILCQFLRHHEEIAAAENCTD